MGALGGGGKTQRRLLRPNRQRTGKRDIAMESVQSGESEKVYGLIRDLRKYGAKNLGSDKTNYYEPTGSRIENYQLWPSSMGGRVQEPTGACARERVVEAARHECGNQGNGSLDKHTYDSKLVSIDCGDDAPPPLTMLTGYILQPLPGPF